MNRPPEPPPEGVLIESARRDAGLSVREAARRAHISEGWWRQVVKGYQSLSGGAYGVVRDVPADTVAKMAKAVMLAPERLEAEGQRPDAAEAVRRLIRREEAERPAPPAAVPGLGPDTVIPAMSAAMKTAARPYYDEIALALGEAAVRWGVPPGDLRGDQAFGDTEMARKWDYATAAGEALYPGEGWPAEARAWLCAIAAVRDAERRAGGGEAAGLPHPALRRS